MKKNVVVWGLAAVVAAAGIGYYAYSKSVRTQGGETASASAAASAARQTQPVTVFTAQQRDVPVTVESAGTVVALEWAEVRPQVGGTIAEVLVKDGQFVKRGQPLFKMDDRADRANLDKAKAQLLRDQASLADLDRQWKRAQELRAQNFIAQSAADTVLANYDSQKAAVDADQAAVRSAEVSLSYGVIAAPLSGRAGAITVNRGSQVQPAGTILVTINQIDPIGVYFSVPETQLAALLRATGAASAAAQAHLDPSAVQALTKSSGAEVSVVVPSGERVRATAADTLKGHVVFVDNTVDTVTGTIRVKAALPNGSNALWPGQYVTVRMTTRMLAGATVIPQVAMIIRGNERSVYVMKADSTVELRPIQTRFPSGEFVVVEGVQPGEKVVIDGKQNLRPGATVRDSPYAPARRASGPGGSASGANGNGGNGGGSLGGAGAPSVAAAERVAS